MKEMWACVAAEVCCLMINIVAAVMPLASGGPGWCCSLTGFCLGITLVMLIQTVYRTLKWR